MNLSCRPAAEKEKGVGFRLCSHSPSFSFSRYEDRERRRGNRTGGCRRKRKCPGESSVRSPGHYCEGISTLVSAAVRAWLVRERTRCRGWQRREEGEMRACSGFRGRASLLLRQNDQQHVLQDGLVLSDDHDHPPVSSPSRHHVSSRQVVSHAAALSDSRAMRVASVRVTW